MTKMHFSAGVTGMTGFEDLRGTESLLCFGRAGG